jgi:hypothetical protein
MDTHAEVVEVRVNECDTSDHIIRTWVYCIQSVSEESKQL